jgi:hypothetical protein
MYDNHPLETETSSGGTVRSGAPPGPGRSAGQGAQARRGGRAGDQRPGAALAVRGPVFRSPPWMAGGPLNSNSCPAGGPPNTKHQAPRCGTSKPTRCQVEAIESGVFRADLPVKFKCKPGAYQVRDQGRAPHMERPGDGDDEGDGAWVGPRLGAAPPRVALAPRPSALFRPRPLPQTGARSRAFFPLRS